MALAGAGFYGLESLSESRTAAALEGELVQGQSPHTQGGPTETPPSSEDPR